MGYMAHDAVIVTFPDYVIGRTSEPLMPDVEAFRESLPEEWRRLLVGPVEAVINGYVTYVFLPDGSREGWGPSDDGDAYREQFEELFSFAYEDGSTPFEIVHVRWGCDEHDEPHAGGNVPAEVRLPEQKREVEG